MYLVLKMKLPICLLQVMPTILSVPENRQIFISKREAGEIFREKRFVFADNLETECIEDKCSRRELEECFDFETGLVKVEFQCCSETLANFPLNFTFFKNSAKPTEKYKHAKQCWFFVSQIENHEEMPNSEHARLMRKCLTDMRFGEILDDVSGK